MQNGTKEWQWLQELKNFFTLLYDSWMQSFSPLLCAWCKLEPSPSNAVKNFPCGRMSRKSREKRRKLARINSNLGRRRKEKIASREGNGNDSKIFLLNYFCMWSSTPRILIGKTLTAIDLVDGSKVDVMKVVYKGQRSWLDLEFWMPLPWNGEPAD